MKKMIFLVLGFCNVVCFGQAQKKLTAMEVLDKLSESLDKRQSCIVKAESSVTSNLNLSAKRDNYKVTYVSSELRFDGNRASRREYVWLGIAVNTKRTIETAVYRSYLWDGNDFYSYKLASFDEDKIANSITRRSVCFPCGMVDIIRGKEENIKSQRDSISVVKPHPAAAMIGYFNYDRQRVDKIIRQGQSVLLRDRMEKINGSACYVLEAKTGWGKYTLWIDPEHGYNLAKAGNNKQAGDLAIRNDHLLKDEAKIAYYLRDVRFKEVDGVWMPMGARISQSRIYGDGTSFLDAAKIHVKVKEWILNPDHEALKSFEPDDIKDGAVVNRDHSWEDGKGAVICGDV